MPGIGSTGVLVFRNAATPERENSLSRMSSMSKSDRADRFDGISRRFARLRGPVDLDARRSRMHQLSCRQTPMLLPECQFSTGREFPSNNFFCVECICFSNQTSTQHFSKSCALFSEFGHWRHLR